MTTAGQREERRGRRPLWGSLVIFLTLKTVRIYRGLLGDGGGGGVPPHWSTESVNYRLGLVLFVFSHKTLESVSTIGGVPVKMLSMLSISYCD